MSLHAAAALPQISVETGAIAQAATWRRERDELRREVDSAHHEALLRLTVAAQLKAGGDAQRPARMGLLCEALALLLGQTPEQAKALRQAAPLHDIGKIGVPDAVLAKPAPLEQAERQLVQQHARMGADILSRARLPVFQFAAELALTHHERWDGSGYPLRLAGEDIPLAARIVAVVDCFDALTSDRSHRKAYADDVALGMLSQQRGAAFDPRVVGVFLAHSADLLALRDRVNRDRPSPRELLQDL